MPAAPRLDVPRLVAPAAGAASQALALARGVETLETAYGAWREVRHHAELFHLRCAEEQLRLDERGALLLGALRSVEAQSQAPTRTGKVPLSGQRTKLRRKPAPHSATGATTLAPRQPGLQADIEQRLREARAQLAREQAEAEAVFASAEKEIRQLVLGRVQRRAALKPPAARLMLHSLPGGRKVLHLQRPGPDESVVLLFVLSRRVPSRYAFLFDDATEDVLLAPANLYADEGVSQSQLRSPPGPLRAILEPRAEVWPVKGMLPLLLGTDRSAAPMARWLIRGPVLEAEVEDGEGFRALLTGPEAEALTGLLLAHQLAGRLDLEFCAG
jgi:hypothetical protein